MVGPSARMTRGRPSPGTWIAPGHEGVREDLSAGRQRTALEPDAHPVDRVARHPGRRRERVDRVRRQVAEVRPGQEPDRAALARWVGRDRPRPRPAGRAEVTASDGRDPIARHEAPADDARWRPRRPRRRRAEDLLGRDAAGEPEVRAQARPAAGEAHAATGRDRVHGAGREPPSIVALRAQVGARDRDRARLDREQLRPAEGDLDHGRCDRRPASRFATARLHGSQARRTRHAEVRPVRPPGVLDVVSRPGSRTSSTSRLDRDEAHPVAGPEQRRPTARVPQSRVRPADQPPAAGRLDRVDARSARRRSRRSPRAPGAAASQPRRGDRGGQRSEVGEAGREPEEEHPVLGAGVALDDLVLGRSSWSAATSARSGPSAPP